MGGLSDQSAAQMTSALRRAAGLLRVDHGSFAWQDMGADGLEFVRDLMLAEGASPAATNLALSAIRGVTRAALVPEGYFAEDPEQTEKLQGIARVRNLAAQPDQAPGRTLSHSELSALLAACVWDPTALGARDAAMVFSIHSGGFSCQELVNLEFDDLVIRPSRLEVNTGPRPRTVPLRGQAADSLAEWALVRGKNPGPLFLSLGKERSAGRMTARNVSQVLAKRSRQADIERVLARDLRHTAISGKFRAGSGYLGVRRVVGPVRVDTLARYDGRDGRESPLPFLPALHLPE